MENQKQDHPCFDGILYDDRYYRDCDPTTGLVRPELFDRFETGVPEWEFPEEKRVNTPPQKNSTQENSTKQEIFSGSPPVGQIIKKGQTNTNKTNTVLDTDWLRLNNLLEFRVGDSVTSIDTANITEFFIKYVYKGEDRTFKFAIAPSSESYVGGPNQTPEVKAGMLTRSSMAIKTFTVAGGEPVYQVLGVEPTLFYVTGLFIGAERNNNSSSINTTTLTTKVYDSKGNLNAVKSAEVFDTEVTKSGRPIELHIYSKTNGTDEEIKIKYRCLVQNARYFMRRSDRVYYALDLFLMSRLS
jgi:hypothetical protein